MSERPDLDELERDDFDGVKLRAALPFLLAEARKVEGLRAILRDVLADSASGDLSVHVLWAIEEALAEGASDE